MLQDLKENQQPDFAFLETSELDKKHCKFKFSQVDGLLGIVCKFCC